MFKIEEDAVVEDAREEVEDVGASGEYACGSNGMRRGDRGWRGRL